MDFKRMMDRTRDVEFQRDVAVWATLVAFGVLGRWLQPMWHFTPTAAVAMFAGYYFTRIRWAVAVPLVVIAISHVLLAPYANTAVMAVVLLAFTVPVALGHILRRKATVARIASGALLPSLVFFVTTNFAVWAFQNSYTHDAAGLALCYAKALPFYRWMLCGDLLYIAVVFGCYAFAVRHQWLRKRTRAVVRV